MIGEDRTFEALKALRGLFEAEAEALGRKRGESPACDTASEDERQLAAG